MSRQIAKVARQFGILVVGLSALPSVHAQTAAEVRDKVRAYRTSNESKIVREFADLLAHMAHQPMRQLYRVDDSGVL